MYWRQIYIYVASTSIYLYIEVLAPIVADDCAPSTGNTVRLRHVIAPDLHT